MMTQMVTCCLLRSVPETLRASEHWAGSQGNMLTFRTLSSFCEARCWVGRGQVEKRSQVGFRNSSQVNENSSSEGYLHMSLKQQPRSAQKHPKPCSFPLFFWYFAVGHPASSRHPRWIVKQSRQALWNLNCQSSTVRYIWLRIVTWVPRSRRMLSIASAPGTTLSTSQVPARHTGLNICTLLRFAKFLFQIHVHIYFLVSIH